MNDLVSITHDVTQKNLETLLALSVEEIGGECDLGNFNEILSDIQLLLESKKYVDTQSMRKDLNEHSEKELIYKLLVLSTRNDFGDIRAGNAHKVLTDLVKDNTLVAEILRKDIPRISVYDLLKSFNTCFKEFVENRFLEDNNLFGASYINYLFLKDDPTYIEKVQKEIFSFLYSEGNKDMAQGRSSLQTPGDFLVYSDRNDLMGWRRGLHGSEITGPFSAALYILYKKQTIKGLRHGHIESSWQTMECFFDFTKTVHNSIANNKEDIKRLLSNYTPVFKNFAALPKFTINSIFPRPEDFKQEDIYERYVAYVNCLKNIYQGNFQLQFNGGN